MASLLVGFFLLAGLGVMQRASADTEYNVWANADIVKLGLGGDVYRWGKVLKCSTVGTISGPACVSGYDGYVGQATYNWMVEKVVGTNQNPNYDYYAIYIGFTMNPSYNKGNPNPSTIEAAQYTTTGASVTIDVLANNIIVDWKPDDTTVQVTTSYGIDVSYTTDNTLTAGFSYSQSYSAPDITVKTNSDLTWGGFFTWNYNFAAGAPQRQFASRQTLLVGTPKGVPLNAVASMSWSTTDFQWILFPLWYYTDTYTWGQSFNIYYPPTVRLLSASTSSVCSDAYITWSQYTGLFFASYDIYKRVSGTTSWEFAGLVSSVTATSAGVIGTANTYYDFKVMAKTSLGYGFDSNVLSAKTAGACPPPPPPPGGCVAYDTPVLTPTGYVRVQDLRQGDAVMGYDLQAGQIVSLVLTGITVSWSDDLVSINHGQLILTSVDQPIYVKRADFVGWVRDPRNLTIGDRIFNPVDGQWVRITSLEPLHEKTRVYDILTSGPNNFIANGYLLDRKIA